MYRRSTSVFGGTSMLVDRGVRNQLRLAWRLLRDERVSALKFALPALIALYVFTPIDAIPDFFLGLGQIDDLGLITGGVLILSRLIPKLAPGHVVDEHLRNMGMGNRPVNRGRDPQDSIETRFNVRG